MSLLALHVFAFTLLAQPATAAPATVDISQLGREVTLLAQLAPLRLSEKQVKAILALYRDAGKMVAADSTTASQLTEMRGRLLAGASVSDKEVQALLATLPQDPRRGGGRNRGGPPPNEMVDKALAVFDDWQQALLINRSDSLQQIIVRRANAPTAETARVLLALASVPKQNWPAQRTRLADRVAAAVGGEKGKQVHETLLEFLDRAHGMTETQIRGQAGDLWQTLSALVPPELPILSLLQDVDANNLRRRAAPLFLDPLTPGLLREIATARGWQVD